MQAIIFNSALSELFKNRAQLIPGTLIYDPEKTDVWHKQKYSSGNAYARAYKYGEYLGRHLELIFQPDGNGIVYLIEGENLLNEIPVQHLWNVEQDVPDVISLYGVAHLITSFLNLPDLIPLPRGELENLFDRLREDALRPSLLPGDHKISYGDIYYGDDGFKYRIVQLTPSHYNETQQRYGERTLSETQSLAAGIRQSPGWEHIFSDPRSHSLIYRRPI